MAKAKGKIKELIFNLTQKKQIKLFEKFREK